MAGFVHTSAHGQLTIAVTGHSTNLMDPRWRCMNLLEVEGLMVRGESLVLPGVGGKLSRRRLQDGWVVGLEMIVNGLASNSSGAARSGTNSAQLAANVRALKWIARPPSTSNGWATTFTAHDGVSGTQDCFVENFQVSPDQATGGQYARVTFDLVNDHGDWS